MKLIVDFVDAESPMALEHSPSYPLIILHSRINQPTPFDFAQK